MEHRPGLDPAVAEIRRAVRECLAGIDGPVLVGLSGGADSLALAAAVAFEAPKAGVRASATVIDHGLQSGSAQVAARAAATAEQLGLPTRVIAVQTAAPADGGGPESAARDARRAALLGAARDAGASAVLLAHTLDDQAETVLIGLARGSGAASLGGMSPDREEHGIRILRPLLDVRRATTRAACAAQGLPVWEDPHNLDRRYLRVRVRQDVMPVLEAELGPGVAEALARTSDQLREDAAAFADMIDETIEDIVEHAEAGIAVSVPALAANPPAIRNRIIRHVVASEFGASLTRAQTLEVARLVTDWHGQGPIALPGCQASRSGTRLTFTAP
ncbi:MAG: tRNA lysidine(34) synthetase TilS [Microbacterium sp. SCN 70-27]|uniref:tRNA lysidine(34) synthetase TilS n=1 Tax=unclassified Microbacterium TaxID=2609290 RepID=UPI00086E142A|nr:MULTISPECIES: tRNA lysidine(34) synthetase TilS [unclassified Microbacterium]MBN9223808.1 tRNA lysidine(34) synthetase TilS [Microbacterium sp.]ODT26950.1 MAG: tRNA lysidine(34) synthetase TilS [Microbacterium sp. SCN 70-27]